MDEQRELFVSFRLGAEWYAVAIGCLREAACVGRIAYVPAAPMHVAGIMNLRGNVVSVIDPKRLLGLPPSPLAAQSRVLVLRTEEGHAGLLVDELGAVIETPPSALAPALPTLDPEQARYVEHTLRAGTKLIATLRAEALLAAAA